MLWKVWIAGLSAPRLLCEMRLTLFSLINGNGGRGSNAHEYDDYYDPSERLFDANACDGNERHADERPADGTWTHAADAKISLARC